MRAISIPENMSGGQIHAPMLPITTEIRTPAEAVEGQRDPDVHWLRELREMRGRVLYSYSAGDRNPIFLSADGTFHDADPFDLQAHHVLLRASERVVACARVSPLACPKPGYISTLLGQRRLEGILRELGTTPEFSCEASRWIVASGVRYKGLGPRVVVASWALARSLGMHTAFVLAAIRYGQDRMLCRMGAQPVGGVATLPAGVINDDLRLLFFNVADPPKMIMKKMEQAMPKLSVVLPCIAREVMTGEASRTWIR